MTTIEELLQLKGVVGILVRLYDQDRTYSEILDEVDVSSTTLTSRLEDLEERDLIDLQGTHRHGQRTQEYYLTKRGFEITQMLARAGVATNYRKMMTHKETVEEGIEEVIDEVERRMPDFATDSSTKPKIGRKIFQQYRQRAGDERRTTIGPAKPSELSKIFGNKSDRDDDEDRDVTDYDEPDIEPKQKEDAWGNVVGEEDSEDDS